MSLDAFARLEKVRRQKPLVHHLTNWVTIYDCAQIVKTLGASPVMAHAPEEVAEMTQIASALVLNIGTLTSDFVAAAKLAAASARSKGIPVVLDVCGAGATRFRDQACQELLTAQCVSIIKGNASEVARVSGVQVQTRGVDTTEIAQDLAELARRFAQRQKATVVITGQEDIVTDGRNLYRIRNGHAMMTSVVGTGCMAGSVIGTFAGIEPDFARAAAAGLVCYEIAAEVAAEKAGGPASFKALLFDALYSLDRETVERRQQVLGG